MCNLICARKTVVEIIPIESLEIFIKIKKDSNKDSRIIRLENEKLNQFKMVLFKYNFQVEFV